MKPLSTFNNISTVLSWQCRSNSHTTWRSREKYMASASHEIPLWLE